MLYTTNPDAPGIIGLLGSICGKNEVNIANFQLGPQPRRRPMPSRSSISTRPSRRMSLEELRSNPKIDSAKPLHFDVAY